MRFSELFAKTLREDPGEAELVSHRLLLRAGMIYKVSSGIYAFLPLGLRVLRKIENIIREEMNKRGAQELLLPSLQPPELWEKTGRDKAFGKTLFSLKDRREKTFYLGPTHEEVITEIAKHHIKSYKDLPLLLYQIQTKFRDEPRPRGGLIRVREFLMKDLYSFDRDEEGLEESYRKMLDAYEAILRRCGLDFVRVEADSGAIGGKESHEFMVPSDSGEDELLLCRRCGYSANIERAGFKKKSLPPEEPLPMEEVRTPGIKTIEDLSRFLGIPKEKTLKAVFYSADGEFVFVIIRGDLDVNEVKLKNLLKCYELRLATEEEVRREGIIAGSASPIGLKVKKIADDSILTGNNFVIGGNKPDTHIKNANYPRDFEVDIIGDIALAKEGYPCPVCGYGLKLMRGIEVGHLFKLGTLFSEKLGAYYLDRDGKMKPVYMGCYGIGLGRLMASIVEKNHDERGIIWPPEVSPFDVYLCPLFGRDPRVREVSDSLYGELEGEGVEVLYDDRDERAGVKFNDADLIGIPVRIVVSERTLKEGKVEVKRRWEGEGKLVPIEGVIREIRG